MDKFHRSKEEEEKVNAGIIRQMAPYMNLGWQLVITIVGMTLLGWWLDGKLHTTPWLIVTFSLFGVAAGLFTFIKTVITLSNNSDKNKKSKKLSSQ